MVVPSSCPPQQPNPTQASIPAAPPWPTQRGRFRRVAGRRHHSRRSVNLHLRPTRPLQIIAVTALGASMLLTAVAPASVFAAGTVTHYVMAPSPIAATASLAAGATASVVVSAEGSTNALVPGAVVYLSFSQTTGGGSASVGATVLKSTPVAFTATTGQVTVTYKTPAVLPMGGKDIVKAANSKSGASITASDAYSFARVSKYTFSPAPIAAPGTLGAGSSASVTLTSVDSSSVAVPGAVVYLSFLPATGGGTASVGATALTSSLAAFTSNVSGQIVITYTAPATLPATGTDTITAADSARNTTITRTDRYSFAGAGATVTLHLTALDAGGHPVAGATVWLYFTATAGGGSANVGSKVLSATPSKFSTNSAGTITVTYKASAAPPTTGTDTIQAENLKSLPTIVASDSYTY